jgi:hypothetical protein
MYNMNYLYSSIVLIFIGFSAFSQNENNIWYFGTNAGLNFNSGNPVAITNSAMVATDNCTSVADPTTGNLLFYSNGVSVWNKNHLIMPNGNGLLGSLTGGNSAFAIKQPGSNSFYYLFTNDAFAGSNGLRYSVIDLSLSGGHGDVTSTKNIVLLNSSTEKITAVKHSNNQDVWIITHPWNSNSYNVYLLSANGLNTIPIVSSIGSMHSGGQLGVYNSMGQISANSTGNRLVSAIYDLGRYELFDFDRTTGMLSNYIPISGYPSAWGAEFSSNGEVLYTTQWGSGGSPQIHQFDLTSDDQIIINNSATIIGTATSPDPNYKAGYLQLGPDNKIYLAKYSSGYLGVIQSPNTLGADCGYSDSGVYLNGKTCQAGLPSCIQTTREELVELNENVLSAVVSVFPNPFSQHSIIELDQFISDGTLNVYTMAGQLVDSVPHLNGDRFVYSRENLNAGEYLFNITVQDIIVSSNKIVIMD